MASVKSPVFIII